MKLSVAYSGVVKVIDSVTGKVELRSLRSGGKLDGNGFGEVDFCFQRGDLTGTGLSANTGADGSQSDSKPDE